MSVLAAQAKASKGKEAPIPAVDGSPLPLYPTAVQCGQCHEQIYDEWASSNHAYASISPMFHAFEQKFQAGLRHRRLLLRALPPQVGTQLGGNRETPLWQMSQIGREGVTCVTCHRVKEKYGKVNGERRIEPGNILRPGIRHRRKARLKAVIATRKPTPSDQPERAGHGDAQRYDDNPQMSKSEFCVSCHQVAVNLGIKLEVVWEQYRDSPGKKPVSPARTATWARSPDVPSGYRWRCPP